jgi:hypothetical protein
MNRRMLTGEEQQHKEELITVIEQVLQAKGKECDEKIGLMSDQELLEILGAARVLRQDLKKRRQQKLLAGTN